MKKISSLSGVVVTAVVALIAIFTLVPSVRAQSVFHGCPDNYTCTPIPPQPPGCPMGYTCVVKTVVTPSITVTYPQAGNILDNSGLKDSGLIGTITWSAVGMDKDSHVGIELLSSTGARLKYIGGTAAGSFAWHYDRTIPNGTYAVEVYQDQVKGDGASGISGYFQIVNSPANTGGPGHPNITLVNPNGGETFNQGVPILVTWNMNYSSNSIKVHLYSPTNSDVFVSAPIVGVSGINHYNIPAVVVNGIPASGGQYKINVCDDNQSPVGLPGKSLCDLSDNYFTIVSQSTSSSATSATLSLDSSSPLASTVQINDPANNQYLGLPVLVFDIHAQGSPMKLANAVVNFSTPGNITHAYLYQGGTQIASTTVQGGIAQFTNPNLTVPADTTVPLLVKVDMSVVGAGGVIVSANVSSTGITLLKGVTSNSTVPVTGSAQGSSITVTSANAGAVVANASATLGPSIVLGNTTIGNGVSFGFTLTAGNNTIFVSANPALALSTTSTGGATSSLPFGAVTANPSNLSGDSGNPPAINGYYVIPTGASRQFTYVGSINNMNGASGIKTFAVNAIRYGTTTNNLSSVSITSGLDNLKVLTSMGGVATTIRTASITASILNALSEFFGKFQ